MSIKDKIQRGVNTSGAAKTKEQQLARAEARKHETEQISAIVSSKYMGNLRMIAIGSSDRLSKGMQNALINEALEMLTEAYKKGEGKFTFNKPDILD